MPAAWTLAFPQPLAGCEKVVSSQPGIDLRIVTAVKAFFQSCFVMLAAATDRELARQVQYLKTENRILRDRLPQRITVTTQERQRLLKYGKPLGAAIRELVTIVSPRTFTRWLHAETTAAKRCKPAARTGRPRTPQDIRTLVGCAGAPNQNAIAERFVQSIKQECLDHFLVFGEAHLRRLVAEYLAYYYFGMNVAH